MEKIDSLTKPTEDCIAFYDKLLIYDSYNNNSNDVITTMILQRS